MPEPHDKSFKERVYEIAKTIPKGKVATYGQIAMLVGSPGAARAVGLCMKQNPDGNIVPCHRVVASKGQLTGYAFGGIASKRTKLEQEGVQFKGEQVNLTVSQWKAP